MAPGFSTVRAAAELANSMIFSGASGVLPPFLAISTARPPTNVSPAAVVSTTFALRPGVCPELPDLAEW
jgi:hypothetical protein